MTRSSITHRDVTSLEIEAVLTASRALIGIAAGSLTSIEGHLTPPQWRALVIITQLGQATGQDVTTALGSHASTATRTIDRLVTDGLVERRDDPDNRRFLALTPTPRGRRLVTKVTNRRRQDVAHVLARMQPGAREALATVLQEFSDAAGEIHIDPTWDLGVTR
jgi:DNA-binding MarR family transcriptional regulator